MTTNEIRLELMDIAEELDGHIIDKGPMGEDSPFRDKAQRLRSLSKELKSIGESNEDLLNRHRQLVSSF